MERDEFVRQARELVNARAPKLGYDYLKDTEVLDGKNVAAIVFDTENGTTYGYSTLYLAWEQDGRLHTEALRDTRDTKDYLHIMGITEDGDDVVVRFGSGGNYSGKAWEDKARRAKAALGVG